MLTFIDVDLDLGLSTATQADQVQLCDLMGDDWSSNPFNAFHDLMADSNFVDMGLEAQNNCPPLDLNIPPYPKYTDKMDNLLRLTGPPDQYLSPSHYDAMSNPPFSLPTASVSSPARMSVTLQTPRLPIWNGNPDQGHQLSVTQCIRQLSELSMSLFEHSTTIPPLSIHDPVPENEDQQETMNNRAKNYSYYSVDETFRVTQELINIYPSFLELFARRKISRSPSADSPPLGGADQIVDYLGPVAPPLSNPLHLDHSAILLILSCHLRVIDIYDQLFKHMKVCIDLKGVVSTQDQACFTAPQLRIGNFVPPMATAVPMQMLLLLHFATSLCDFAVQLDGHIRDPENGCTSAGSSRSNQSEDEVKALSLVSAQKVKERATGMLQHLSFLRGLLLREGHLT